MKVTETKSTIIRTEEFQESFFGIDNNEDLAHIFNILRSKIYSDKVLAVIREYSTNAQDAHVLAGTPNREIKVTLPNIYKPYFTVRDYGPGLSEEAVRSVYVKYGKSTKRDSNEYNGQLGLGCKAGFAYGDSFLISSFQNGIRKDFECYIDETKIGKINKLQEVDTTEENGMLISIPVKNSDVNAFTTTASKFYEYFTPFPEINLIKPELAKKFLDTGIDWKLSEYNYSYDPNKIQAIMGNVRYPIDTSILKKSTPSQYWNSQIESIINNNFSLLLNFNIGDLSISSSRESLEYDQKTVRKIVEKIQYVFNEVISNMKKEITNIRDIFHAKELWSRINHNILGRLFRHSNFNITFDGLVIDSDRFDFNNRDSSWNVLAKTYDPPTWGFSLNITARQHNKKLKSYGSNDSYFDAEDIKSGKILLVLDDADKQTKRIKTIFLNEEISKVVLFCPNVKSPTQKSIDQWIESQKIPKEYFKKLSDYEPLKNKRKVGPVEDKHQAKVFLFDRHGTSYSDIDAWDISDIDIKTEDGYYVPIDRFLINGVRTYVFKSLLENIEEFLDLKDIEVYGIKQKLVEKLGPNMKNFFDEVKEILEAKLKDPAFNDIFSSSITKKYLSDQGWTSFTFLLDAHKDEPIDSYLDLTDPRLECISLAIKARQYSGFDKEIILIESILGSSLFAQEKQRIHLSSRDTIANAHKRFDEYFPLLNSLGTKYWINSDENRSDLAAIINYIQIKLKSDLEIINFEKEKTENEQQGNTEDVSASNGSEA